MLALNQFAAFLFDSFIISNYAQKIKHLKTRKALSFFLLMLIIFEITNPFLKNFSATFFCCIFFLISNIVYQFDEKEATFFIFIYGLTFFFANLFGWNYHDTTISILIRCLVSLLISRMIFLFLLPSKNKSMLSQSVIILMLMISMLLTLDAHRYLYWQLTSIILFSFIMYYNLTFFEIEQNNHALHSELEKLKISLENTRLFRHDYNNNLCAIGGYISVNDMKGLRNFYTKISGETIGDSSVNQIPFQTINEPSIYALLINKFNIMAQNQIQPKFDSKIDFSRLCISSYDLCKVLGILLDNAIEAAKNSFEREIIISCRQGAKHQCSIQIANSYTNKAIDINKIFEKGYSSKEVKSGLGLWEVKRILKTNKKVHLDTQKNQKYFSQILSIQSF